MATTEPCAEQSAGKRRHTRNACDACRARKTKCKYGDDNSVCESCRQLSIPCTQDRPRKRRGPTSRYVEELRRKEQERPPSQETISSSPQFPRIDQIDFQLTLDQLAPKEVIDQIINDWFELVHPVAPILHRDSFIHQLYTHDPYKDQDFIRLAISVCAATVATLQRRTMAYASSVTVERCHQLIESSERQEERYRVSLVRCQWKYNLSSALVYEHGYDSALIRLLGGELNAMITHLVYYELENMSILEQELTKRLYWLLYAGSCTNGLHGRSFMTPVNPFNVNTALRPREVLDTELEPLIMSQGMWHGDSISYIPGLNALSDLYLLWHRSQLADCSDLSRLNESLNLALVSLDDLSPALRWRGGLSRPPRSNFGTDVQMVNLYITQIHIRAFLLDQMHNATRNSHGLASNPLIMELRQNLINDMLAIVYQMPEEALEANGHSLIRKLRDIGLALLNEAETPASAPTSLSRLLAKLDRLDVRRTNVVDSTSPLSHMTSPSMQG